MTRLTFAANGSAVRRLLAAAMAITGFALLIALSPAPASAGVARIKVKFPTLQSQVAGGQARLAVSLSGRRSRSATPVRLVLQAKQPWSGWTAAGAATARPKTGARPATVRIRIRPAAAAILRNCGSPKLRVTAKYRSGRRTVRRTVISRALRLDRSRCAVPADVDLTKADTCDFIAPAGNTCLAPFPNDFYTRTDASSGTGLRVNFAPGSTPKSSATDRTIDVSVLNQSDGFSPGQSISVQIPGMDNQAAFDETGIVPEGDMSQAYAPNQPALLIDAATGERQLIWGELDSNAAVDADRNLILRPGKNLTNGHRYIVALRNMKDSAGNTLVPPPGFRIYRDNNRTLDQTIEKRRNRFESIFRKLGQAGVKRSSLYLAWDFTVASTENITGRMLSIRDRAFALLGDTNLTDGVVQGDAPDFTITDVVDNSNADVARRVTGTFEVPCYLNLLGCPRGAAFDLDSEQKPIRIPGNTFTARFRCNIPKSAIDGGGNVIAPVRPSLYGHGLFNEFYEVGSGNVRAMGNENGVMNCATDWIGMSSSDDNDIYRDDRPYAISALQDLSRFPAIADRLQQGFLNFAYLARLLIHDDGFTSDPAFQFDGESVIDTSDVFYWGNSQGGIAGGAFTAIAPDITRSVLYVPGMNYSTLLPRSKDFNDFSIVLYPSYRDQSERPLLFSLMQMMWDRGEPNGYANNMTDNPLPNTPAHKVMLVMAWGDHEVANVATEVEARTIGAPLRSPTLDSNRLAPGATNPFFEHEILGDLNGPAADGNAFFVWDTGPKRTDPPGHPANKTVWGTDPAPLANIAPNSSFGQNPHDTVVEESNLARKQIADFIKTNGKVTNPCGANPCYAAGWNGFP
jgi:hypothetical protein